MTAPRSLLCAAGTGTRLLPLTRHVPKCLLPVGPRPLLDFWMIALADAGVRDVLISTHHLAEQVREYIGRVNAAGGQRLAETWEPRLLGSAGTLTANRALAEEATEIVVIYADNFSDVDLAAVLAAHRRHPDPVTMVLFRAPVPQACGIVELDAHDRIVDFVEKPEHPRSDLANAGIYVLDAHAYREMADARGFDIGRDLLPRFVGRMRGWVHTGYHQDIGTPAAYMRAQADAERVNAGRGMDAHGCRPAVFLDRDGVLIEPVHYLCDPERVRLAPGAAGAVVTLRRAGYACVVVSNQSAVGRGIMSETDLRAVNERMCTLFAEEGAVFDALYHCPIAPAVADRTVVEHPDRKPGPGMIVRAAADLRLDVQRSWMIGDAISDILAGVNAGCRGSVLLQSGAPIPEAAVLRGVPHQEAGDLAEAAAMIVGATPVAARGGAS